MYQKNSCFKKLTFSSILPRPSRPTSTTTQTFDFRPTVNKEKTQGGQWQRRLVNKSHFPLSLSRLHLQHALQTLEWQQRIKGFARRGRKGPNSVTTVNPFTKKKNFSCCYSACIRHSFGRKMPRCPFIFCKDLPGFCNQHGKKSICQGRLQHQVCRRSSSGI